MMIDLGVETEGGVVSGEEAVGEDLKFTIKQQWNASNATNLDTSNMNVQV
jgi:hypothetical protein